MRACDQCGSEISGRSARAKRCSDECDRKAHVAQVVQSQRANAGKVREARPCAHCGEPIIDKRRPKFCRAACQEEAERVRLRADYARRREASGGTYRPMLAKRRGPDADESVRQVELDGHKRCSNSACGRFVLPGAPICPDCLPRFDAQPIERASYGAAVHATFTGEGALA